HRPHPHAEREQESRPEVDPPLPPPPDRRARDRLGELQQAEEEDAAGEHPVDDLGGRVHSSSPASSGAATSGLATQSRNRVPAATTQIGGSTSRNQKPCPCGCNRVMRYGWRIAQTIPATTVSGPISQTARARAPSSALSTRAGSAADSAGRSTTSCDFAFIST